MHATDAIRGMLLPIPTVFDGTGEVDEPLMREMTRFYLDAGIHALFVCGSFGQGPAMRLDQRKAVAELIVQEVRGRIPVIIHIGTVDPYSAVELGQHARAIGADGIGVVGPFYYSDRTPEELVLHFQMIDAAVQLPILVYNNPGYQGYAITPALMQRLVAAVPRIFGAKLAMGTIPEALEYLEQIPGFAPFILGNGLLEGMRQGIRGTVSPPLAATPELGVDLIRAIDEGRDEEARRLQDLASEVNDELIKYWKKYGRVAFAEALRALGFPIKQYPRWPTPTMAEEDRQAMLAVLKCARPATVG
ncbi:MAG TPA: dihydrodipicolinate synthase family protein [Chloroflexota bacterium]|nr:dihydrodipicolinate synthase family protein [Chloroflexota bacterium]